MGNNPSRSQHGYFHPVESVSRDDVQEFIRKLNAQTRSASFRFRLPTEAEWEYACRAGGKPIKYAWGNEEPGHEHAQGNIADDRSELKWRAKGYDDGYERTAPVGRYAPNALGLHDMTGNVSEWVQDGYDPNAYRSGAATDPVSKSPLGKIFGDVFNVPMVRGGSWRSPPDDARCTNRSMGGGDRGPHHRFPSCEDKVT